MECRTFEHITLKRFTALIDELTDVQREAPLQLLTAVVKLC